MSSILPKPHQPVQPPTSGQTLLEIIIAIGLFSSLTVILLLSITHLVKRQSQSTKSVIASFHLQQAMENVYAISQTTQWNDLLPNSNPPYYIQTNTQGSWDISTSPHNSSEYQTPVYVHPAYRDDQGNFNPDCTQTSIPQCQLDTKFKKIVAEVHLDGSPMNPSAAATYFLTNPNNISPQAAGPTPAPNLEVGTQNTPASIISASDDDAHSIAGNLTLTSPKIIIGGSSNTWTGLRFTDVTIPPNAIISSAHILLQSVNNNVYNGQYRYIVYADLNPANPSFATLPPTCFARTCTTVFTQYSEANEITSWEASRWYNLADLTEIIQETMDTAIAQGTWGTTNVLTFLIRGANSTAPGREIYAHETGDPAFVPQLYITYLNPTPTP